MANRTAYRVRLKRGGSRKRLLLVEPPYPKRGDVFTIERLDWTVTSVTEERVLMEFKPEGGKLRQVFP